MKKEQSEKKDIKRDRFGEEIPESEEPEIEIISGEVPMYRTYGVTKKYRPRLAKFNNMLAKFLVLYLIVLEVFIIAVVGVSFWFFSGELIGTVVTLILLTVTYRVNTRIPRARKKFVRNLKKLCEEKKYSLEFKRGFWSSLSWADKGGVDFILKANGKTYYVRYATSTKKLSTMSFLSGSELVYTKHPRNNKFTLIFDFKDRKKVMHISFPDCIDGNDKSVVKAILINPVPMNIEKKGAYGIGMEPTGTGERMFGYTIFNATGFIETLKREGK
jgi:hypothetical protein